MPTILAILVSSVMAYVPDAIFGDSMSTTTSIVVSMLTGSITYAWLLWYFRRLRGE